jgi:hypothetical protein
VIIWLACVLQILFDKQHTPLFDTGLTLGMRLLYTSGEPMLYFR